MRFHLLLNLFALNFVYGKYTSIKDTDENNCIDGSEGCRAPPPKPPENLEPWVSVAVKKHHDWLFRNLFKSIVKKGLFFNENEARNNLKPYDFKTPESLSDLNFTLCDGPCVNQTQLLEFFEQIMEFSPRSSHPFNLDLKSGSGIDPYAIAADWIITVMTTPMLTYIFAPVFTIVEMKVLEELRKLIGSPEGVGDGVETPHANGFAIQSAIQHHFEKYKEEGIYKLVLEGGLVKFENLKPVVFISQHGDSTFEKEANVQGIGSKSIIYIKAHPENGTMIIEELEKAISEERLKNHVPILLVGTAGTHPLGAIDPLDELAAIAKKYDMWYHVDSTLGGGLLFSPNYASLLKGISKADSISFSPIFLFGTPPESYFFFTPHRNFSAKTFGIKKPKYVYKTSSLEKLSLGDLTTQTSRRSNSFKMWLLWKIKGSNLLGMHIDHLFENKKIAMEQLKKRNVSFHPVLENFQMPSIHFTYIPPSLRNGANFENHSYIVELDKFTDNLRNKLLLSGTLHLSVTEPYLTETAPNFMSVLLTKSVLSPDDIKYIFDSIERCGEVLDINPDVDCVRITPPEPLPKYKIYTSTPIEHLHKDFIEDVLDLILDKALYFQEKRSEHPLKFREPEELMKRLDFSLGAKGVSDKDDIESIDLLSKTIEYSSHFSHPFYMYQLTGGLDPYAVMADIVTAIVPSPQSDYEDNPLLMMIEKETGKAILERVGWIGGQSLFPPGGSAANLKAMHFARFLKHSDLGSKGLSSNDKQLRVYFSGDSHYSFAKGAYYYGIGKVNGVPISSDNYGKMNTTELRLAIESDIKKGYEPLMVGATFGTTILGAIDPIEEIATLCEKYDMWFHVDGAYGGSVIMSNNPKIRGKLKGLERLDSGLLMTCMVIRPGRPFAQNSLAIETEMELHFKNRNTLYDKKWDLGTKYLERMRRASAFKFWVMWKAKGSNGISNHIDYILNLAQFVREEMRRRDGFWPLLEKFEMANVIFMFVPKKLRHLTDHTSDEFMDKMEEFSFQLQRKLVFGGVVVMVTQRHNEHIPYQLKYAILSSGLTREDVIYQLNEIERIGNSIKD